MYFDYLNVLVFASVGFAFVLVNMVLGSFIRPKRPTDEGLEVYECGEETIGETWIQFDIRYYTVALIYVIFAVEIAFLFPWAMVLQDALANDAIGLWALAKGFLFVAVLFFGLVAVWAKGDLDWVLTYEGAAYRPPERQPKRQLPTLDELAGEGEDASDEAAEGEEAA